jgi:hypothetical protein
MHIRIVKHPPAPVIDGFDVRALHVGRVYELDTRTAHYLIVAGYAARVEANDRKAARRKKSRNRS